MKQHHRVLTFREFWIILISVICDSLCYQNIHGNNYLIVCRQLPSSQKTFRNTTKPERVESSPGDGKESIKAVIPMTYVQFLIINSFKQNWDLIVHHYAFLTPILMTVKPPNQLAKKKQKWTECERGWVCVLYLEVSLRETDKNFDIRDISENSFNGRLISVAANRNSSKETKKTVQ